MSKRDKFAHEKDRARENAVRSLLGRQEDPRPIRTEKLNDAQLDQLLITALGHSKLLGEIVERGQQLAVETLIGHLPNISIIADVDAGKERDYARSFTYEKGKYFKLVPDDPNAWLLSIAIIGKTSPQAAVHLWKKEEDGTGLITKAGSRFKITLDNEQYKALCKNCGTEVPGPGGREH